MQLREKRATTREFLRLAREVKAALAGRDVPLLINDRVDVALAAGADGVHLGQSDLPVAEARRLLGPDALIGLSVETPEQADEAEACGADYLGVSPVFRTPTKADTLAEWGLDGLRALRTRSRRVLIAIGGINESNAAAVLRAGADGLAVVSALCAAPDPREAARRLRARIEEARTGGSP